MPLIGLLLSGGAIYAGLKTYLQPLPAAKPRGEEPPVASPPDSRWAWATQSAILTKYPQLQAIIFDQAHVVNGAENILTAAGVSHRVQLRGGDFFASVPSHGDLYIISRVLLNWEDEYALKILKNCRAAMSPSAYTLLVKEHNKR
jgi:hypothetical protein